MKKLFTFCVAMAMVAMSFAQIAKPVYPLNEPVSMNVRTDWYGYFGAEYFTTYEEGDIYFITFPAAGDITAPNSKIDKVCFGWQATGTDENDNTINFDPNFKVVIFVGGNTDWLDTNPVVAQNNGWYTNDTTKMGTRVYEQVVDASAANDRGIVTVELTTPYNIADANGQQIWVAVECLGNTCGYIGNLDDPNYNYDWRINLQKYYSTNANEHRIAPYLYYKNSDRTELFAAKSTIAVYVNDGTLYRPKSDWLVEMYSPDDIAQYPDNITWWEIDEYTDSLAFYGGGFNMGIDSSYGICYIDIYAEKDENRVYLGYQNEPTEDDNDWTAPYSGFRLGPVNLMGVADFEEYNLTYPFQLCFGIRYESEVNYNGVDPDTTNNVYCITVSDQPDPSTVGINENSNMLKVSPNPASTYIKVENAAGSQIFVYNIAGQEVMSVESAEANETINVSDLTAGLYIVRVVNGNEVSTAKVSIVR